jgi:hypothetical protein
MSYAVGVIDCEMLSNRYDIKMALFALALEAVCVRAIII